MKWTLPCRVLAACAVAIPSTMAAGTPTGHAKNGDTHVTGIQQFVWDRGRELRMTNRISQVAG